MRSKFAKRSRSLAMRRRYIAYAAARGAVAARRRASADAAAARRTSARVDREHLLGRLAEEEALAEVDAELLDVLELGVALDADRDDAAAELVGDLDERADEAAAGRRGLDALAQAARELGDGRAAAPPSPAASPCRPTGRRAR